MGRLALGIMVSFIDASGTVLSVIPILMHTNSTVLCIFSTFMYSSLEVSA